MLQNKPACIHMYMQKSSYEYKYPISLLTEETKTNDLCTVKLFIKSVKNQSVCK